MALKRGTKVDRGYATVSPDEGVNYREIADTMTDLGFIMNHSSARNYIIRIMKKFITAVARDYDIKIDEKKMDIIAKSPVLQQGIADLLQSIEAERRTKRDP